MYVQVWCTTLDLAVCIVECYNVNSPLIAMTYISMKLKYMQFSLEAESLSERKRHICIMVMGMVKQSLLCLVSTQML